MQRVATGRNLIKLAWKERRAVKTRVESAQVINVVVFHADASQHVVPTLSALLQKRFKRTVAQFFKVLHGLRLADKRRGHAGMHLFAAFAAESNDGPCMVGLQLLFVGGKQFLAIGQTRCGKIAVEHDNKIVLEVIWHAPTIPCGVAHNGAFVGQQLYARALVESIYDDVCRVGLWKSKAHQARTLGRSKLGRNVVVGQVHLIMIRFGRFGLVREPRGALFFVKDGLTCCGHEGELAVIVNPRTRLVCLFQSPYLVSLIAIRPPIAHFSRLGSPKVHAPRHGRGGIGVASRKLKRGLRAHQRAYIINGLALCQGSISSDKGKCQDR